ncbi:MULTISPECIES: putative adhesin [Asticcacaulis]|uniref:putative adhesin n=1 Tax=Asticcacaulis TaxID=76890 RepID=UPI001AE4144D|nr:MULTISPECIES: LysM peptidoglycan-binding domain-containing protein [Asticcacaulis]MBP2161596.1 YD repeat-containing protein [Asticcacaulis solisilvae]MDR6802641.1 YD repeat-containing protein [Asticcacaulis sp. BE141]
MSATHGSDGHVETYAYTADGYLKTVLTGGVLGAARVTDVLGRLTSYTEYKANGATVLSTRSATYDADSRVTFETTQTYNDNGTNYTNEITNNYLSGGVEQGVVMSSVNKQYQNGSLVKTINSSNSYVWWNQAKSSTSSVSGPTSGTATYSYDANGNLSQVNDAGVSRVVTYQTDSFGQVLSRKETNSGNKGAYRNFFYLEGHVVGDVGNDLLASQTDYAQQLATNRNNATYPSTSAYTATPVTGVGGTFHNYQALNTTSVAQSGSTYTVMAGDTLQSVAQNVWGDASLWFMLAEANGLSGNSMLAAGQSLTIPGKIANMHNASGLFKPYNASDAMGNTTPTRPPEPQPPAPKRGGGCGVIGDIIATIISIVVQAVVTPIAGPQAGAAAGNIVKQGFRIAVGNQKKFNWAEVAAAAIGAHFEAELGWIKNAKGYDFKELTGSLHSAARSVGSSIIRQGANMAFGVQKSFDWTSLAVAGVAGGVTYGFSGIASDLARGNKLGTAALTGTASLLAGAATRSILTGDSFGKSVRDALPDAIGSTIGGMISDAVLSSAKKAGHSDYDSLFDRLAREQGYAGSTHASYSSDVISGGAGDNWLMGGTGRRGFWSHLWSGAKNVVGAIGNFLGITDGKPGWQPTTTNTASNFSVSRPGGGSGAETDVVTITGQKRSWWDKTRSWISTTYSNIKSSAADMLRNAAYRAPETQFFHWSAQQLDRGGHKGLATLSRSIGTYNAEFKIGAVQALGGAVEGIGSLAYNGNPIAWANYGASKLGVNIAPGLPNAGTIVEPMRGLVADGLNYAGDTITGKANPIADGGRLADNYIDGWKATAAQGPEAFAKRLGNVSGSAAFEVGSMALPATKLSKLSTLSKVGGTTERLIAREVVVAERALGGSEGLPYARTVLDGGSGRAIAGHGEYRLGSGDFVVPEGTAITLPREGISILDETGQFMERGDWEGLAAAAQRNPRIANDIEGMTTYLPGSTIPDYTLRAPNGLTIYRNSTTVGGSTPLSTILEPNLGCVSWAACTVVKRY